MHLIGNQFPECVEFNKTKLVENEIELFFTRKCFNTIQKNKNRFNKYFNSFIKFGQILHESVHCANDIYFIALTQHFSFYRSFMLMADTTKVI